MCVTGATFKSDDAFLKCHSRFSSALVERLSLLVLLLAVALTTTSCGTLAQANGVQNNATPNNLILHGNFPAGTVSESYNAVLAVGGGKFPYHFSVKTGALPPGISLNPTTGSFSGKPTSAGTFSFEVIVTDAPNLDQGNKMFVINVSGGTSNVNVSVSPATVNLVSNQKQQFTATVNGTSNTGVKWSATAGSVDANGLYTAPTVTTQTNLVVKATSDADSSKSSNSAVTVDPVNNQGLKITTGNLPEGQQGNAYNEVFTATGGTTPYVWSISAGTSPAGVVMNANGDFAGMPTTTGTSSFTVTVTDATAKTATGNFSVTVVAGSNFDGPADPSSPSTPGAICNRP
jgi:large repetitive protein